MMAKPLEDRVALYAEADYERIATAHVEAGEIAAFRREDVWINEQRLDGLLPDRRERILWWGERARPDGRKYQQEDFLNYELLLDVPLGTVPAVGVLGFCISAVGALNLRDLNSLIFGICDGEVFLGFQRGGTYSGVLGWVYSARIAGDSLTEVEDFSTYQPMDGHNDGVPEKFSVEIWLSDDVHVAGLARVAAFARNVPAMGFVEIPVDFDRTRPFRLCVFARADDEEYALGSLSATVLLSRIDPHNPPQEAATTYTTELTATTNRTPDPAAPAPHIADPMMKPLHWIHRVGQAWGDDNEGHSTARTGRGRGVQDPFTDPGAYGGKNRTAPAKAWRSRRPASPRRSEASSPRSPRSSKSRASPRRGSDSSLVTPRRPLVPRPLPRVATLYRTAQTGPDATPRTTPRAATQREFLRPEDERLQMLYYNIRKNPSPGPIYARTDGAFKVQPERRLARPGVADPERLQRGNRMGRGDRFQGLAREYNLIAPNNGPGPAYNPSDGAVRPGARAPKFASGDPTSRRAAFLAARARREKARLASEIPEEEEAGAATTLLVSDRPGDEGRRPAGRGRARSAPRGAGRGARPAWARPAPRGSELSDEDDGGALGEQGREAAGTRLVADREAESAAGPLAVEGSRFPFSTGAPRPAR